MNHKSPIPKSNEKSQQHDSFPQRCEWIHQQLNQIRILWENGPEFVVPESISFLSFESLFEQDLKTPLVWNRLVEPLLPDFDFCQH